jgi:Histidine kinase-, DNA gyrase B-, and HSP90-like ATPase
MATKPDWNELSHDQKLGVLARSSIDQIVEDYQVPDIEKADFRSLVTRELVLWQPKNNAGKPTIAGRPPNKEVVLGAWRDLDRSEALLELIDNSIDAWKRRSEKHPQKTAKELNIHIGIDSDTGQLMYEDNASGVPVEKLVNLVVPGHSETDALATSIGSYKTGGKKAIFRLASAVNITTRYWNPAETDDRAASVHLDDHWLNDVEEYQFPYFSLADQSVIERGQTRYIMQLRSEPIGNPWFTNPQEIEKIKHEIQRTYSLLMARNNAIKIYFPQRATQVSPELDHLYDFAGTHDDKLDIRPQLIEFNFKLDYEGKLRPVQIEILIGCRVSAGVRDDIGPGFDLYGNNRLFKYRDRDLFADFLPKGNVAGYIRGYVNIKGPNVFIPWDTHKRHLNTDREIIDLIRTHPTIREFFANWKDAFSSISILGRGEVTKTVATPFRLSADSTTGDLGIEHKSEVEIDPNKKRGQKLPGNVPKPKVGITKKKKNNTGVALNMVLATEDARQLAARFAVEGKVEDPETKKELSEKAKEHLLGLIKKPTKKK